MGLNKLMLSQLTKDGVHLNKKDSCSPDILAIGGPSYEERNCKELERDTGPCTRLSRGVYSLETSGRYLVSSLMSS